MDRSTGIVYAILFGWGIIPPADDGGAGLIPALAWLREGTVGLVVGLIVFLMLGTILYRVGQRKLE